MTLVFLSYNRREELRESLRRMLEESDYDPAQVDVIVVDNASTDGSADMVRGDFPQVRLIARDHNCGVSAINDGLAAAGGEYVLALDDDCYLLADGLRRAVTAAREYSADLVSFKVVNPQEPGFVYNERYQTGLFLYWGCAVLLRRQVLERLGGYDPEIFIYANELEFMIRFFDSGFCHLHYPDVVAQHSKKPPEHDPDDAWELSEDPAYRFNARHFAYVAGKLLWGRDATAVLLALLARVVRDTVREHHSALGAVPETLRGFANGLHHRSPVRKRELSRFYRENFHSFAGPWRFSRPIGELARALPRELLDGRLPRRQRLALGRRAQFYAERPDLYPTHPATLSF